MRFAVPLNPTGYGVAGYGYARAWAALDPELAIEPIGEVFNDDGESLQKFIGRKDTGPGCVFWFLQDSDRFLQQGYQTILTTFETDGFTPIETAYAKKFKKLITASAWGAEVLRKNFPAAEVHVAQHAYLDVSTRKLPVFPTRNPQDYWRKILDLPSADTLVLSTAGKYERRKGYRELFNALILDNQPTLLLAACHNQYLQGGFDFSDLHYLGFERIPHSDLLVFRHKLTTVIMVPWVREKSELIHRFLLRAHSFISASKGEGWNLPLAEMMAYGMHCIAPLHTGHLEYCDQSNVTEIECAGLEVASDGMWFLGNKGRWYDIRPQAIQSAIQKARDLHFAGGDVDSYRAAAQNTIKQFSWEKSARVIQQALLS